MMEDRVKDGTNEAAARSTGARAKAETARKTVSDAYSKARDKASSALDSAKDRANAAYGTAREKGSAAYDTARTRAAQGRDKAAATLDENPVAALVGGLALGALVAALLPRGRREAELLSSVGGRISETSRRVANAARDSARESIDNYGLTGDSALEKVTSLFENATKAASSIGTAAREALKER
jgi:hypothetical protein